MFFIWGDEGYFASHFEYKMASEGYLVAEIWACKNPLVTYEGNDIRPNQSLRAQKIFQSLAVFAAFTNS